MSAAFELIAKRAIVVNLAIEDGDDGPIFVDRKSTRLNSSHSQISYAVFCLKKKQHFSNPFLQFSDFLRTQSIRPRAVAVAPEGASVLSSRAHYRAARLHILRLPTVDTAVPS